MNTTVKLVLDTNIFIAIIGKKSPFRWVFDRIITGEFVLCISNDILLEYQEILERKTNQEVANNIVQFLNVHPFVIKTEIFYQFQLIHEDPDDNKFVDCAVASNAILVTNDKHFNVLKTIEFPKIKVLSLSAFTNEIKS